AEDGIRDFHVTGVQTCALPIWRALCAASCEADGRRRGRRRMSALADRFPALAKHWQILREAWENQNLADKAFKPKSDHEFLPARSEERRVGKESRARWARQTGR